MRFSDLLGHLPTIVDRVGEDVEITGIQADSRLVEPGDLFIAIPGLHVDGHQFIEDAVNSGAVAVIGEMPLGRLSLPLDGAEVGYCQVPNAREAWGWSCATWEHLPSRQMTLVGVTGTDGKTTTVTLIHGILRAAGIRTGMISTVKTLLPSTEMVNDDEIEVEAGLHTTTPDPPEIQRCLSQMVARGASHAVLEVTSHGLAQARVAGCDFDVAVLTNITHEHLDFHGSEVAYRQAKAKLFEGLKDSFQKPGVSKACVLNGDDPSIAHLRPLSAGRQIIYSLEREADVMGHGVEFQPDCTCFELQTPIGHVPVETPLVGRYNVYNALAAAAVGVALGIPLDPIARGIGSVSGVPGRMERIDEGQPYLAIVDFAHTPNALEQALTTARRLAGDGSRVITVFGNPGERDRGKRALMGTIAARLADVVIITADDPRTESLDRVMAESAAAAKAEGKREGLDLLLIRDRGRAILHGCQMADPGDVVIACGKGHQQSMPIGRIEYPWDDRKAMRLAVRGKALSTLPTAKAEQ